MHVLAPAAAAALDERRNIIMIRQLSDDMDRCSAGPSELYISGWRWIIQAQAETLPHRGKKKQI